MLKYLSAVLKYCGPLTVRFLKTYLGIRFVELHTYIISLRIDFVPTEIKSWWFLTASRLRRYNLRSQCWISPLNVCMSTASEILMLYNVWCMILLALLSPGKLVPVEGYLRWLFFCHHSKQKSIEFFLKKMFILVCHSNSRMKMETTNMAGEGKGGTRMGEERRGCWFIWDLFYNFSYGVVFFFKEIIVMHTCKKLSGRFNQLEHLRK